MNIENVAQAIRFLRKTKNLTQKDLAKKLGVSDKAISKWERGIGIPDVSLLSKLSIILDTDIESLLDGNICHNEQNTVGLLIIDNNEYMSEKLSNFAGTNLCDKPLIHYIVSQFLLLGINEILITCSKISKNFIENHIDIGSNIEISITCIENSEQKISLEKKIEKFINGRNFMFIDGYHFLYGLDMTKILKRAMIDRKNATVFAITNRTKASYREIFFDSNKKATIQQVEKHERHYRLPIIFCSIRILQEIGISILTPIDELCDRLVREERLYVELIGRGMFSFNILSHEDVNDTSCIIDLIQKTQDIKIFDLEEIAYRRGLLKI